MALPYTYTPSVENPLSDSGNWVATDTWGASVLESDATGIFAATPATNCGMTCDGVESFSSDQYLQFGIAAWISIAQPYASIILREQPTNGCYRIRYNHSNGNWEAYKMANGGSTEATLASTSGTEPTVGDVLRASITGSAANNDIEITLEVDTGSGFATVLTATEGVGSWTSGQYELDGGGPGIQIYQPNDDDVKLDSIEAGNIGGNITVPTPKLHNPPHGFTGSKISDLSGGLEE